MLNRRVSFHESSEEIQKASDCPVTYWNPSKKELERRLIERNKGKNEKISERLAAFEKDATHWNDYDYVIINDNLENCFKQIEKIIESHQIKSF